jgi:hypothetical protein
LPAPSATPPNVLPTPTSIPPQPVSGTPPISHPSPPSVPVQGQLVLPNPGLHQTNPDLKKKTAVKYADANFSPDEKRGRSAKYYVVPNQTSAVEESRGTKRARAEDLF